MVFIFKNHFLNNSLPNIDHYKCLTRLKYRKHDLYKFDCDKNLLPLTT